jgi:glucose/mannose-6-phosphate isomerase
MKKQISEFTQQLNLALQAAEISQLTSSSNEIKNVVISGMGGSGISGDITADAVASEITVPVVVNKNYSLPNYVNKNTLVIITSYSGETEETVKALQDAINMDAKITCITSGGEIAAIAGKKNIDLILMPKRFAPRAAIGFSLAHILKTLNYHEIISSEFKKNIFAAIKLIDAEEKNIIRDAKETAAHLIGKLPIIYSTAGMESIALRFRQQLNENSKMLCWHNVFPELDHNELQGWTQKNNNVEVVVFRNDSDYPRTAKRIKISSEIISHYVAEVKEVYSKGNSVLERMLYLIHWGDWVSYFVAEMKGVDTMDIRMITYLKSEMAKAEVN